MREIKLSLLTFLVITRSINLFGQIESQKNWPVSIQKEFEMLKERDIDNLLVYYYKSGTWNDHPDSCKNIYSVYVLFEKDKNYYARELSCDSVGKDLQNITDKPFNYILNHRNVSKLRDKYFKKTKVFTVSTDTSIEYLILMTKTENTILNLSNFQRTDKRWNSLEWVKVTIEAIDLVKKELGIK